MTSSGRTPKDDKDAYGVLDQVGPVPPSKVPPPNVPPSRVRAAGGVVWRRVPAGTEIVLVHRPAYDDWALPKGKAGALESDEATALREVKEETGLSCRLGGELPSTTYVDALGRPKTVRYWAMTVVPVTGQPLGELLAPSGQHEVDAICWAPLSEARQRLTYPRDVVVLDAVGELLSSEVRVRRQKPRDVVEGRPGRDRAG